MALNQVQPSAFARSEGLYLTVIQNMATLIANNYQIQGEAQKTEATMTNATATANYDALNSQASSMQNQAIGEYAMGGLMVGGATLGAGAEAYDYAGPNGTRSLSAKLDTMEENERLFFQNANPRVGAAANPQLQDPAQAITDAKNTVLNNGRLTPEHLDAARTNMDEFNAIKQRVKDQRTALQRQKSDLDDRVKSRQGLFTTAGQGLGPAVKASYSLDAAQNQRDQAAQQANQQIYKYLADTNKSMSDMDAQGSQALVGARDAALQNLEAIVRSNQPN